MHMVVYFNYHFCLLSIVLGNTLIVFGTHRLAGTQVTPVNIEYPLTPFPVRALCFM